MAGVALPRPRPPCPPKSPALLFRPRDFLPICSPPGLNQASPILAGQGSPSAMRAGPGLPVHLWAALRSEVGLRMGSGHRVVEQGPSQVGKSGPCEGPACKAPSRLPCPCRAQPWVLKAQTWILLSFASVARTTGHMKTGDPQGTMPLWPLGRDLPPHLGTWPSHVRALPASFKPSCPHPAPNPDHWEPTLPCPCPTLLLSVASEVSTTALTVDQCSFPPGPA